MLINNIIGIIADDLTGANDTALQFYMRGCNTEIVLNCNKTPEHIKNVDAWATSTESRNIDVKSAKEKTFEACKIFKENFGVEFFYKKIDSTLRGNVAEEILSALEATEKDIAIIAPAFIQEGRITIGGYQLVKGVPIERTEAARDPSAPIFESNIVNILKKQLEEKDKEKVGLIEYNTISKGAASITLKINELASSGKKLIVCDALSVTDIEQIVLAMKKSNYDILPAGSAGLAQALAQTWVDKVNRKKITKKIPPLPKLVLSGSATELVTNQIKKLQENEDFENIFILSLHLNDILDGLNQTIISRISANLTKKNVVIVHVGEISKELEDENSKQRERLIDEGISRTDLAKKITDYLAELLDEMNKISEFLILTIGGETSYKCAKKIQAEHLTVVDAVLPAIPLCIDYEGKLIITKSGNLGNTSTLIEIIKYFNDHE